MIFPLRALRALRDVASGLELGWKNFGKAPQFANLTSRWQGSPLNGPLIWLTLAINLPFGSIWAIFMGIIHQKNGKV